MRVDPSFLPHLLAQSSEYASSPPWIAVALALITATGAIIGPPIRSMFKARAEREAKRSQEESERHRAKHEAELEQMRVVTSLASSVPALTEEIRKDRQEREKAQKAEREALTQTIAGGFAQLREAMTTMLRTVESNTKAVDALTGELHSDRDEIQRRIAERLGVESSGHRAAFKSRPDAP